MYQKYGIDAIVCKTFMTKATTTTDHNEHDSDELTTLSPNTCLNALTDLMFQMTHTTM